MRTKFICSIDNEAVLKALFKVKDNELTFAKAIEIAIETEDAAKVANETLHGLKHQELINKIQSNKIGKSASANQQSSTSECIRCGRMGHSSKNCRFQGAKCHYCGKIGHLQSVCMRKKNDNKDKKMSKIFIVTPPTSINMIKVPELQLPIKLEGKTIVNFEVDTGAADNFLGKTAWSELGEPKESTQQFKSASQHKLPILGTVNLQAETNCMSGSSQEILGFNVTEVSSLNLLGRNAVKQLWMSVDTLMKESYKNANCHTVIQESKPNRKLQEDCKKLCNEFPELFKPELGKLKNCELEVKFKHDAKPVFSRPRAVPFAV